MYGASKTPLIYILFVISINTQAVKNLNDTEEVATEFSM